MAKRLNFQDHLNHIHTLDGFKISNVAYESGIAFEKDLPTHVYKFKEYDILFSQYHSTLVNEEDLRKPKMFVMHIIDKKKQVFNMVLLREDTPFKTVQDQIEILIETLKRL